VLIKGLVIGLVIFLTLSIVPICYAEDDAGSSVCVACFFGGHHHAITKEEEEKDKEEEEKNPLPSISSEATSLMVNILPALGALVALIIILLVALQFMRRASGL